MVRSRRQSRRSHAARLGGDGFARRGGQARAPHHHRHRSFGTSNPITSDPGFAAKVAERVRGMIVDLGFASEVYVRTFGSYNDSGNTFYYNAKLSVHAGPKRWRPKSPS